MGVDFIQKRAKSFSKAWDRARIELVTKSLFTEEPDCIGRALIARAVGPLPLEIGSSVIVRADNESLFAEIDLVVVARFVAPTRSAMEAVRNGGGYATGTVITNNMRSGLAEITVC